MDIATTAGYTGITRQESEEMRKIMTEMAIEVRGYAYEPDGGGHMIALQDAGSHSVVAAYVKAFARYCKDVQDGELSNFYLETVEGELVWHTEPVQDLQRMIDLVRDDQRESDPDLSASQAVWLARRILSVPQLDQSDALSFAAYHRVLRASEAELRTALAGRH